MIFCHSFYRDAFKWHIYNGDLPRDKEGIQWSFQVCKKTIWHFTSSLPPYWSHGAIWALLPWFVSRFLLCTVATYRGLAAKETSGSLDLCGSILRMDSSDKNKAEGAGLQIHIINKIRSHNRKPFLGLNSLCGDHVNSCFFSPWYHMSTNIYTLNPLPWNTHNFEETLIFSRT